MAHHPVLFASEKEMGG